MYIYRHKQRVTASSGSIWKVKQLTVSGEPSEWDDGNTHYYSPGKQEWVTIKESDDYYELENWMTDYIRKNHLYYDDFKITH